MHPAYQALYSDMMADIHRCQGLDLPERERAESCFWIAHNYCERLKDAMTNKVFDSDQEEIGFFKCVKPRFTSWMDYFILLSESLMFVPVDRQNEVNYWESESLRFQRFCNKHLDLVSYLEKGEVTLDHVYFLRRNAEDLRHIPKAPVYDVDPCFCTAADGLVKSYLAQRRFYEFVMGRVEKLKDR